MLKRCLYCGIRLKVESAGVVIRHCPACSIGLESDDACRLYERAPRDAKPINRAEKEPSAQGRGGALVLLNH